MLELETFISQNIGVFLILKLEFPFIEISKKFQGNFFVFCFFELGFKSALGYFILYYCNNEICSIKQGGNTFLLEILNNSDKLIIVTKFCSSV